MQGSQIICSAKHEDQTHKPVWWPVLLLGWGETALADAGPVVSVDKIRVLVELYLLGRP